MLHAARTRPAPPPKPQRPRCAACSSCHPIEACAGATKGLRTLLRRATKICEGRRYLLAEVIGVSEAGLSRAAHAGKISPELRGRLIGLVRVGVLPDDPPLPRRAGRRARSVSPEARSVTLRFTTEAVEREFLRLAEAHQFGRMGVLVDALRAHRARHRTHPPILVAPAPPRKLRCKFSKMNATARAELEAFDAWIGGAENRPLAMPVALAEFCGAAEVYVRRRPASTTTTLRSGSSFAPAGP